MVGRLCVPLITLVDLILNSQTKLIVTTVGRYFSSKLFKGALRSILDRRQKCSYNNKNSVNLIGYNLTSFSFANLCMETRSQKFVLGSIKATFRSESRNEKSAAPHDIPERKGRKIDIPRFIWIPRSTARPNVEPEFANTIRMRTSNRRRKSATEKGLNAIARSYFERSETVPLAIKSPVTIAMYVCNYFTLPAFKFSLTGWIMK